MKIFNGVKPRNFKIFFSFIFAVILTLGLSISFQSLLAAWVAPVSSPPACTSTDPGCTEPLNKGPLPQIKGGSLKVNMDNLLANGLVVYGKTGFNTIMPRLDVDIVGSLIIHGINNNNPGEIYLGPGGDNNDYAYISYENNILKIGKMTDHTTYFSGSNWFSVNESSLTFTQATNPHFYINSNKGIQLRIDADEATYADNSSFAINNGDNKIVFSVDEAGVMTTYNSAGTSMFSIDAEGKVTKGNIPWAKLSDVPANVGNAISALVADTGISITNPGNNSSRTIKSVATLQNVTDQGVSTDKSITLTGSNLYFNQTSNDHFYIDSKKGVRFHIDTDSDESSTFEITKDAANTNIFKVDEDGDVTMTGKTDGVDLSVKALDWNKYMQWDGSDTGLDKAAGRTSLGLNTLASATLECGNNEIAKHNGTTWVCASDSNSLGTVTSISAGVGITATPNPIIDMGTISLNLASANTWTAKQIINAGTNTTLEIAGGGDLTIKHQTSGVDSSLYNDTGTLVINTPLSVLGRLTISDDDLYVRDIYLSGTMHTNYGADLAEGFDVSGAVEAGDVLIIDATKDKMLKKSSEPYSKLVAGVVSTKPGIKLGDDTKVQVALTGTVPVKATNENGEIQAGDLLTTSTLPGYAMKCSDQAKCFGATLGKALEKFSGQTGIIKMLISLQ